MLTVGKRLKAFWSRQHRRDGFLLGLAVGTFGVTFGVLSVSAGVSGLQAVMMSLLMFTGASQRLGQRFCWQRVTVLTPYRCLKSCLLEKVAALSPPS